MNLAAVIKEKVNYGRKCYADNGFNVVSRYSTTAEAQNILNVLKSWTRGKYLH